MSLSRIYALTINDRLLRSRVACHGLPDGCQQRSVQRLPAHRGGLCKAAPHRGQRALRHGIRKPILNAKGQITPHLVPEKPGGAGDTRRPTRRRQRRMDNAC